MIAHTTAPRPSAMRGTGVLVTYLLCVFLVGALVAPWIYRAVHALAVPFPALEPIARYTFRRYVHRSVLVFALLALVPFARSLGLRSWRDVGFDGRSGRARGLVVGLLTGILSITAGIVVVLLAGARTVARDAAWTDIASGLAVAVGSAATVAVIEETLFRGVLFGALRRAWDWRVAMAVTSMIYGILHFFGAPPTPNPVVWTSGFDVLPEMLAGFVAPDRLFPALLTLVVAGVTLTLSRQWTGGLHHAIGLHAGWVFWVRSYDVLTRPVPGASTTLWGSGIMIDGWLAVAVMSLTLAGLVVRPPPGSQRLP